MLWLDIKWRLRNAKEFMLGMGSIVGPRAINPLLNGFDSDLTVEDKTKQIGLRLAHFNPINAWQLTKKGLIDVQLGDTYQYGEDSPEDAKKHLRIAFSLLIPGTLIVQPIALTANILNRLGKVISFSHFWVSAVRPYSQKERGMAWLKDICIIVATPLVLAGLIVSVVIGFFSPFNGRKLYGSFERLAYAGGYDFKSDENAPRVISSYGLARCFQPESTEHTLNMQIGGYLV